MRRITGKAIFWVTILLAGPLAAAVGIFWRVQSTLVHPFYGPFLGLFAAIFSFYALLMFIYRIYLYFFSFPEGELKIGSTEELRWMIYVTLWLMFFNIFCLPRWVPVPLTRVFYRLMGAKIGESSYFGGVIYDPHFVEIGSNVLGGALSMVVPHVSEGSRLAHHRIRIGSNVTLGAGSIILPGVTIEDGVMVGAGAVIRKFAHLKRGEVWAGNPARFIKLNSAAIPHPTAERVSELKPV